MDILKFVIIGIICAVISLLLRQIRPEMAPFAQIAAIIIIVAMLAESLKSALNAVSDIVGDIGIINDGYILILIKIAGIAIVTKTGADICRDCGNSAVGTNVELAGKVLIFVMCLPFIKTIVELADGLLS